MILPDIWGKDALFCYSGLCGETVPGKDLVGMLCGDTIGISFENQKVVLSLHPAVAIRDFSYIAVTSDALLFRFNGETAQILFTAQNEICGICPPGLIPFLQIVPGIPRSDSCDKDQITLCSIGQKHFCLLSQDKSGWHHFSFCSAGTGREAVNQCQQALTMPFNADTRLAFYQNLPCPSHLSIPEQRLLAKCYSVMRSQIYSPCGRFTTRWTTPDRLPHQHAWLWDSVFHSIGNVAISPELAADSLRAVLASQREDGFIAHMITPDSSSDVTQPPLLAWGVRKYEEQTGDLSLAKELYPYIAKYLHWIEKNRDINRNHLYEWYVHRDSVTCRCGESGMDNSPRFDGVAEMDCLDFSCYMANEARIMTDFADRLGLSEESQYWQTLFCSICDAVNSELWDEKAGMYFDYDLNRQCLHKVWAVSSFLPLFAGICPEDRVKRLTAHLVDPTSFQTISPIPSIAIDDPTFGDDMWRGPVWMNMNYLIIQGLREYGQQELAATLRQKSIDLVRHWYENDGVLYEFYDSNDRLSPVRMNRKGPALIPPQPTFRMPAVSDYGWTATLTAALLLENPDSPLSAPV